MKKVILFTTAFLVLIFIGPAISADFIIGAKAGYFIWEPFIKDINASGFSDIDKGTGVLYGPVLSATFAEDYSLSVAALTGEQSTHWASRYTPYEGKYLLAAYYFEAKRTDIDAALSYRVIENLKIFGGYKYQLIKATMKMNEIRTDEQKAIQEISYSDDDFAMPAHGPALGLGYSHAFARRFFATANLSGLYMNGKFKMEPGHSDSYDSSFTYKDNSYKSKERTFKTRQTGMNFEPSVGYSSGDDGFIFTLGFRYQWLKIKYLDEFEPGQTLDPANDYLYGVFISVLYSF